MSPATPANIAMGAIGTLVATVFITGVAITISPCVEYACLAGAKHIFKKLHAADPSQANKTRSSETSKKEMPRWAKIALKTSAIALLCIAAVAACIGTLGSAAIVGGIVALIVLGVTNASAVGSVIALAAAVTATAVTAFGTSILQVQAFRWALRG